MLFVIINSKTLHLYKHNGKLVGTQEKKLLIPSLHITLTSTSLTAELLEFHRYVHTGPFKEIITHSDSPMSRQPK